MACNENVIKNMANEITRNCQAQGVLVDTEFVVYLIELLLLNPKYGRLFSKTISRNNLEFFVNDCVEMLTCGETSINTLKMQFTMQTSYDKLSNLIDKHINSIDECLRPLINEILEEDPELEDDAGFKKLFRKISIYIILSSGLGNPGSIVTLKEGMAALESVFSIEDLKIFVALPRSEKVVQLHELMEITSGVRLFNRDCKKGGEGIPDLPFSLVDAGEACAAALSHALMAVRRRASSLGAAADAVAVQPGTGTVLVDAPPDGGLTADDYKHIFELLAFNRQYELYIRKLLSDVESMALSGSQCVDNIKMALEELHSAVKYKAAVPVVTVFPLFTRLWRIWRSMQNIMFLMSTVTKVMSVLASIQEKISYTLLDKMLEGKKVVSDQERVNTTVTMAEKLTLGTLKNYVACSDTSLSERYVEFLGFCALCLTVGALVPSNAKVGLIKWKGSRYGFCSVKMAAQFSKDPQRYINEVLEFARNNTHVINLLNILEDVDKVKDIENLVTKYLPKIQTEHREVQTEAHPIDEYVEKNYTWDMWEWKRRACQWVRW